jgi:predicted ATPase
MVVWALTGLVAKSLVAVTRHEGRTTFRLHDLTRAYALERIHDDPFACEVFRRHAGCLYAPVESWLLKHCADEPGAYASGGLVGSES